MSAPVDTVIQAAEIPALVELFELDLSVISAGAPTLRFVGDHTGLSMIRRGSNRYWPVPLEVEGFDRGGAGAPPQPTLRVGNVWGALAPWVWAGQDLVGATLRRVIVLRSNLDDGDDPDSSAYLLFDDYMLEQKTEQTPTHIAWRLVASIDQGRRQLPGRQVIRDVCQLRYRIWTGSAWDYSQATCPYTGASMWDVTDTSTATQSEDLCSKRISGCRLRFAPSALPTSAFPGVGRRQ